MATFPRQILQQAYECALAKDQSAKYGYKSTSNAQCTCIHV